MHPARAHPSVVLALLAMACWGCTGEPGLFRDLPPARTGLDFVNRLQEDSVYNVMTYMNIYTGAGVAAGDVNKDGLTDLYLNGNQSSGRLYLNRGDLQFEDVTEQAGLLNERWATGASMADVNQDGWLDIYVNVAGVEAYGNTANLLYINQGDGTFRDEAARRGLADTRQTMHATFLDYDGDLDLDLFLIVNPADLMVGGVNRIRDRMLQGESPSTDILYRNDGDGTFTDVSAEAGILVEGYSLGAAVSDLNQDGRPDLYVSNDFLTNDILYINQGDGTFRDEASRYLRHTSFASMGNDIADINNDGLPDIYVLDMLPEDNYRRKMIIPAANYNKFQMALERGYDPQYTRNTLQLNNGDGTFSDVAWLAGLSSTDWSWSALWADYDNDADRDLMVTNGFYRDLGNLDYINYQLSRQSPMGTPEAKRAEKRRTIEALEQVPLRDYLFENQGDLSFADRSEAWGFREAGFSNGAAYADLDNDGDLELVINRINQPAKLYQNLAQETKPDRHFLRLQLQGRAPNRRAIGAKLWLFAGETLQYHESYPWRGYESSVEPVVHFGLGKVASVDSLLIAWPGGPTRRYTGLPVDTTLHLSPDDPVPAAVAPSPVAGPTIFRAEPPEEHGITHRHRENAQVDFDVQPLLPHMHSRLGPGLAVGDTNGDGRDDLIVGGAAGQPTYVYHQRADGSFQADSLPAERAFEDAGLLLFDADGDGDLDLYAASGGTAHPPGADAYRDRLYLNDGSGYFEHAPSALPDMAASSSCVVGGDYDGDGDIDLFIGGRVLPGAYPRPGASCLLRNDTAPGSPPRFVDATTSAGLPGHELGMVSAALWTDVDQDDRLDLLVTGEFMTLRLFRNTGGLLVETTDAAGLGQAYGWWNSLAGGDFDADGDTDYIAGNLGLNSRFRATPEEPLCIYANDYDRNGTLDPVMCYFVQGENYVAHARDEMVRQIPAMRQRFTSYEDYASVTFRESFLPDRLDSAYVVRSNTFASSYFENRGDGTFKRYALPRLAQVAPVYGILPLDADRDGRLDLLLVGNAYGVEASHGPYDALNGLWLRGDGTGNFRAMPAPQSGFRAPADAKGLVGLMQADGSQWVVVGNNDGPLQLSGLQGPAQGALEAAHEDRFALIERTDGSTTRVEFYYGQGYWSQSARRVLLDEGVVRVSFYGPQGQMNRLWEAMPGG